MPRKWLAFESTGASAQFRTLATVGWIATRTGVGLIVLAVPLAVVTFLSLFADAATLSETVETAGTAMNGPLTLAGGVGWLFHVGVFTTLVGCWLLGLGLILSGLLE